jgi:putative (di)nucleoside polyphosphate hydrolase
MPTNTPLPLRPNVCIILYNQRGQLLLGERLGKPGYWQFPQGGIEPGSAPRETVRRELQEELGLPRRAIGTITQLTSTHAYEWHNPPPYALNRWRGQDQSFWLVQFLGSDADINLAAHEPQEFRAWRWCSLGTVPRWVPAERRAAYAGALRECKDLIPLHNLSTKAKPPQARPRSSG